MIPKNQIKNKKEISKMEDIKYKKCKLKFGIDIGYIGIVTCPYCGEYVEG